MKQTKFNENIWGTIIEYSDKHASITMTDIQRLFPTLTSSAIASYHFALRNRANLHLSARTSHIIGNLRTERRSFQNEIRMLGKENDRLDSKVDFLLALDMLEKVDFTKIKISQSDMSIDENTAIALFSDAHIEEVVEKAVVNFINEYNPDIATFRIKAYFSRLLFVIRNFRKGGWVINHLVFAMLGDLITGHIHEELVESNAMSPIEATMFAQELMIAGIKFLAEEGDFKTITVIGARGNHSRTTSRKRYSTGYKNSYEWLMYTQIAKYFRETPGYENITFIIPQSEFAQLQIYDKKWLFGHGDHFNYRGGVGGVMVPFRGWMYKMGQILPSDKFAIGHWHQYVNLPDGIINGSIIGYSPFAIGKGFSPEPPQQQLQIQDSKRGFTINTPIILHDQWDKKLK